MENATKKLKEFTRGLQTEYIQAGRRPIWGPRSNQKLFIQVFWLMTLCITAELQKEMY